ncbi:hypothetical protein Tco_0139724 [Tanacetum coccineum]
MTFYLFKCLQVEQRKDGIFLSQDKYVYDILKKFGFSSVKTTSTPMETHKPLSQDTAGTDVDVHLYRSMIGSLMYLTSSRPDIIYLKGQPTLGLWYPKDPPMDLIDYSDSDYAGASIDRKSTTGGCQFLGCRLISWQCKKQTIVANSTTEAEYIAASNCCGQVLWLQNQLLDYGYNFMKTKIHVDNESAICVVKNLVYHSKTKHMEIKHHFIRDSYEKKSIEMVKIHTDYNVADLLTKAFDVTRFQFLIASIGEAHDVYYALKYDWEDLLHQTKSVKHIRISKEVRTLRYLSLVVPLTKVGDEAIHKKLGDRMERAATTASSLEAEQDSDAQTRFEAASKSPMIHLSQEVTHLEVGRTNLNQLSIHQMATLEFCDKHNMVAYLEKPEGSAEFHHIIDFLLASHIHYVLTENPTTYASFIKQFWTTATTSTNVNGDLEDNGGITSLPNTEIFEQLALMGYATDSDKLTFQKGNFSPQWRFIQICLNKQRRLLQPHTRIYSTPVLTQKVFSNIKRVTRGYSGEVIPLFPSMITSPKTSPSRITSSPSLSPQHTPVSAPSTSPPPITETTPTAEEPAPMPHESPLQSVQSIGRDEGIVSLNELMDLLVKRVKKLEKQVKTGKARRRKKIVLSEDEAIEEDSSK